MDLASLLIEKGSSIERLANSWWTIYGANAEEALALLTELMFHAGGWTDFKFNLHSFPTVEKFKNVKENGPLSYNPLIMKCDEDFQSLYVKFVSLITETNKGFLLNEESFYTRMRKIFDLFSIGKWDSFRLVVFITGRILWISLQNRATQWKCFPSLDWLLLLKDHNWSYSGVTEVNRYCDELRSCYEFLSWSIAFPTLLLEEVWHRTILCWMRERNSEINSIAYMAVFHLFKNKINMEKQMKLMKYIKPDLIYSLIVKSCNAEISMRILLISIRYMDIEMNQAEIECLIAQLYEPVETDIALLAGSLFCTTNIVSYMDNGPSFIIKLIEVNAESYMGSEDLLIDSIYMHIHQNLSWRDWIRVIVDSPKDTIVQVLSLMCAYVRKVTRDHSPKIRAKRIAENLILKKDRLNNCKEYTRVISKAWMDIASYEKVMISASLMLVKLVQYFDSSIDPKVIKEIAYVLCGLHRYTKQPKVSDECCKSLEHLVHIVLDHDSFKGKEVTYAINLLVQSLAKLTQQEFTRMLNTHPAFLSFSELALPQNTIILERMLSACRWITFDDSSLWNFVMEKLISVMTLPLTQNLIQSLLTLLFQMVMKTADQLMIVQNKRLQRPLNNEDETALNSLMNVFVTRAIHFKLEAKHFLNGRYNSSLRSCSYFALLDLLEYSHVNFQSHNHFLIQVTSFDEEEIVALVAYVLEFMEYTNCKKHFTNEANIRCCCFTISRLCYLISRGFLDLQLCLTPFIRLIGKAKFYPILSVKNTAHDEIIIRALHDYSWMFPHKWEYVTVTIYNSLISMLDDTLMKYISPNDINDEFENVLLWSSLQNLVELLNEGTLREPIVRAACLKLHTYIINCALGSLGHASLLKLLYSFKHWLFPEDLTFVISYLQQHHSSESKTKHLEEIEAYIKYLKRDTLQ